MARRYPPVPGSASCAPVPSVLGHPLGFALRHPRRVLNNRRTTRESAFVHRWLDGLRGIEIGAAAHNDFGVDALNVDRFAADDTVYKGAERLVWARGGRRRRRARRRAAVRRRQSRLRARLARMERFPDPIAALLEWRRVARRCVSSSCRTATGPSTATAR